MEIDHIVRFEDRHAFREWLHEHADDTACCWVILSRKTSGDGLLYLDAVEEALCFGWIDGIAKKTEAGEFAQRFSPRRKNSNWTELNKERVRRLIRLGMMQERGLTVLPDMSDTSFVIDEAIVRRLKKASPMYTVTLKRSLNCIVAFASTRFKVCAKIRPYMRNDWTS